MEKQFADRREAGRVLARTLERYAHRDDVLVLALPRGGVPVAFEIALALGAALDVLVVRKVGAPGQSELAMGAISASGTVVLNDEVIRSLHVSEENIASAIAQEREELERRAELYRDGRAPRGVVGKTVILVDDGLATGSTMRAAVMALRGEKPGRIVVAVPVGTPSTCREFQTLADDCVCAITPQNLRAVGLWYIDFTQTTDEEVRELILRANDALSTISREATVTSSDDAIASEVEVSIAVNVHTIRGTLVAPREASGVVLFAHGSGSSRHSPRNGYVAKALQQAGLATLLLDLLEEAEAEDRSNVFDVRLMAARLEAASDWVVTQGGLGSLRQGYFGASTGAAVALLAAAERPGRIAAVVSRGGRPDLAREALGDVKAATLLIVGGADEIVLELNREAFDRLSCVCQLDIVPGATHLFAEPGALEEVTRLAVAWFGQHLTAANR